MKKVTCLNSNWLNKASALEKIYCSLFNAYIKNISGYTVQFIIHMFKTNLAVCTVNIRYRSACLLNVQQDGILCPLPIAI